MVAHGAGRLKLIAVEDVGMGEPLAPLLLNCLH